MTPKFLCPPRIQLITNFPRICSPHSSSPGPVLHNSVGPPDRGFPAHSTDW